MGCACWGGASAGTGLGRRSAAVRRSSARKGWSDIGLDLVGRVEEMVTGLGAQAGNDRGRGNERPCGLRFGVLRALGRRVPPGGRFSSGLAVRNARLARSPLATAMSHAPEVSDAALELL